MRYSKRTRPSLLHYRFGASSVTLGSPPGEQELLRTSMQEELRRCTELEHTQQRLGALLKQQTDMHNDLKGKFRVLADCEYVPKFRVLIDPLVFASSKIREEVRNFVLKTENSVLAVNKRSQEHHQQVESQFAMMASLTKAINSAEAELRELRSKTSEETGTLSTKVTLEALRFASAERDYHKLQEELASAEQELLKANQKNRQALEREHQLESDIAELGSEIGRYSEEIKLLEEGAANQTELARRMIQMELLESQHASLLNTLQQQQARHNKLLAVSK